MVGSSGPGQEDRSRPGPQVCLRCGHREVLLSTGKYTIGRSSSCHVILDAPLVSRRHALIEVGSTQVTIQDLNSLNGVFVNGIRVRGNRKLTHGDTVSLGAETFETRIGTVSLSGRVFEGDRKEDTLTGNALALIEGPPKERLQEEEDEGRPTLLPDDLELIGAVAERALQAGHVADAENMLRAHLDGILVDAGRDRRTSPAARVRAFGFAIRLAQATGKASWFHYAIDLLRAERTVCTSRQLDQLRVTMHRVIGVDARRLAEYGATLRSGAPTMESLRAAQQVDELASAAAKLTKPKGPA